MRRDNIDIEAARRMAEESRRHATSSIFWARVSLVCAVTSAAAWLYAVWVMS